VGTTIVDILLSQIRNLCVNENFFLFFT